MLKEGDRAPAFSLPDGNGRSHKLGDYKGKNLVLYFYPRDDTPGCTIEARDFTRDLQEIHKLDAEVLGVSNDDKESHCKFTDKYSLKVTILCDPENKVIKEYDAYGNKGVFGWGTIRKTYVIGRDGKILKIYPKVTAIGHSREVIEFLKSVK